MDIAIEGSLIKAVGPNLRALYPQANYREMGGKLVMPGIVCAHNHFYSGLSRGIMANIAPCPDFISTLKTSGGGSIGRLMRSPSTTAASSARWKRSRAAAAR